MNKKQPSFFDQLVETVGVDCAFATVEHFGGRKLYVPSVDFLMRMKKRRDVQRDFLEGEHDISWLAADHDISPRQARRYVSRFMAKDED